MWYVGWPGTIISPMDDKPPLILLSLLLSCFSGQQLAQQMQQANPELVEQLRSQMQGQSNASSDNVTTNDQSQSGNLYLLMMLLSDVKCWRVMLDTCGLCQMFGPEAEMEVDARRLRQGPLLRGWGQNLQSRPIWPWGLDISAVGPAMTTSTTTKQLLICRVFYSGQIVYSFTSK